jgi:membrane-associated two-gene conflict system component 1 (EACC1)
MTELTISAPDDGPGLVSLHSWLLRSPELTRHSTVRMMAGRGGGSMGAVETIGVVVSSATAIGSLLVAYRAWRDARVKPPAMTITINQFIVPMDDPSAEEKLIAELPEHPRHAS